jgi:hypothetical protein
VGACTIQLQDQPGGRIYEKKWKYRQNYELAEKRDPVYNGNGDSD